MTSKILSVFAAMLLLAACETASESGAGGSGSGRAGGTTAGGGAGGAGAAGGAGGRSAAVRPGTQEDLVVNVGDRVFFDVDQFTLKPEARTTLNKQAQWLKQFGSVSVVIEGHCDERGTREYNLALGERRATAVLEYLLSQGVPPARVKATSFGKERPAVVGTGEAVWAQNRRSVTVVN